MSRFFSNFVIPVVLLILIIAGFLLVIVSFGALMNECFLAPYDNTSIESASIQGQTEGSFGLFAGTISEEQYYFYYVKQDDGLILDRIRADDTVVLEGATDPFVETHMCRTNYLHVPNGTVVMDYSIVQPGVDGNDN